MAKKKTTPAAQAQNEGQETKGWLEIPSDDAPGQAEGAWVKVITSPRLTMRHFKSMLFLPSMGGMQFKIQQNREHALKALGDLADLLSNAILDWNWKRQDGQALPKPHGNPDAFGDLDFEQIGWLIDKVLSQEKPSKNR